MRDEEEAVWLLLHPSSLIPHPSLWPVPSIFIIEQQNTGARESPHPQCSGGIVPERPRILVLEGSNRTAGDQLQGSQPDWNLVRVDDPTQGLALLRTERFDGIYADTH